MQTSPSPLSGLWLPLITPFRDGDVDRDSLTRLLCHYLDYPIDGIILAATTGESLTLDEDEIRHVVDATRDAIGDRLPVYLGLSGSDTHRLARRLEALSTWPVDGYLISSPSYSRPSQAGLYDHFATLADASDRPLVLYNIPYRTGVNLQNETVLKLAELPMITGLKDCCVDIDQTFDLLRRRPGGFSVMTGEDVHYYNALVHGADGAILASAHVETHLFAAVRKTLWSGDQPGALARWADLIDVSRLLFAEPSPAAIKYWLWRQGLIASPELRLPMKPVSSNLAERLDAMKAVRADTADRAAEPVP